MSEKSKEIDDENNRQKNIDTKMENNKHLNKYEPNYKNSKFKF